MLDVLDIVRTRFGGRPLLLFLVVLIPVLLASRRHRTFSPATAGVMLSVTALFGLVGYLVSSLSYAIDPNFYDYAEPTMTAVGWLFQSGQPVYPAIDAAERYAHIYGPVAFMVHGVALSLFGPSIVVSKVLGAAAGIAGLALTCVAARSRVSLARALQLTGVLAVVLLMFRQYSFWTRPEPFQLAFVAASLVCALRAGGRGGLAWAAGAGVASGLLWDLKVTGPLYSLPIFALLRVRSGWRGAQVAGIVAAVVAVLPFLAFSNISLSNYFGWMQLSANTGLQLSTLRQNLEWAMYLSVPLLVSCYIVPRQLRPYDTEWRLVLLVLPIAVSGVAVAAAKPGAGPYHLLPFLPIVVYVCAVHLERFNGSAADPAAPRLTAAFVLTAAVIAATQQGHLFATMRDRRATGTLEDIVRFAATHSGVIEVGYGTTEALTLERPSLVFRNNTYLLDQPAVREHQLAGLEVPRSTIEAIGACRVEYWLIPRGEAPFSGTNGYPSVLGKPLFPEAFRQVFHSRHRHVDTTKYFDVWRCDRGNGS
jgi:hypothetical protein